MATSTNTGVSKSGETTVSSAGTAEQLATGFDVAGLTITAKTTNAAKIYVGGNDVDSSTNDGLSAGDTVTFSFDVSKGPVSVGGFYIDADTTAEGVDWYANTRG
jgi:hypothetical protein